MEQKKLQKTHYDLYGYSKNPAFCDGKSDYKFHADDKKQVIGLAKIMLDNFDCEHIAIFRIDGYK